MIPSQIISGGQTGADQGALIGARQVGIATGGWMPRGFRTENGFSPELAKLYGLREHPSPNYPPRTRQNVREADGTIWIGDTRSPGYHCTMRAVNDYDKLFVLNPSARELKNWVERYRVAVLNVAGHCESRRPGIHRQTAELIIAAFGQEVFL